MPTIDLHDLRVVITGARGGIGSAATAALCGAGARVAGIDVAAGPGIISGDVTQAASVTAAAGEAAERLGGIDVLVNCAGVGEPQDAGAFPDAAARRIMDVNFWGAWNATAACLPHLVAARGQVVSVASMLARVDLPFAAAYMASKRALDAWSAALRLEYRGRLEVTVVYPGYIRTGIHRRSVELGAPLEGLVRAEHVDDAAAGILRAVRGRPREVRLTALSSIEHAVARHLPRLAERAVRARLERAGRPRPAFVRSDLEPRP